MSRRGLLSRRRFLGVAASGAAVAAIGVPAWRALRESGEAHPTLDPDLHFPLMSVDPSLPSKGFSGDEPERAHALLWRKGEYLAARGGIPRPSETVPLVIVGGGVAGLSAAHYLRDLSPVLLEQGARLGGNSQGERWQGLAYSTGAAYVTVPEEGSLSRKLLDELGLLSLARIEKAGSEGSVLLHGRIYRGFWSGATDPSRRAEFRRVAGVFARHRESDYPDLPLDSRFHAWDRMSFRAWLDRHVGSTHPHIEEYLRQYCWSSFAADDSEVSAAQALNFLLADLGGTMAFPGGNAAITHRLSEGLAKTLPAGRLRTSCLVADVVADSTGVTVAYLDSRDRLRSIRARACVMACPKFVAARVVSGLPEVQLEAMRRLKYRAYLVANLVLSTRLRSPSYELFRIQGGGRGKDDAAVAARGAFTDLVFGAWAAGDLPGHSALTFYRSVPFDAGRAELHAAGAAERTRSEFELEIPALLATLGLRPENVARLGITRRGHALPVAGLGLLADGVAARASKTWRDRVFFAAQDNWANPAFETALGAAWETVAPIRRLMS